MKLSVVLPFYNEEKSLPRIESELLPVLEGLGLPYEIVGVDDGSTDGSAALAERLRKKLPQLKLVRHPHNRGLGAAVRSGFAAATGDLWVTFESDFTYPPVQIAKLVIRHLETQADCVAGTTTGSSTANWFRRMGSAAVNGTYRLWAGPYTAWTPLFRLYKADAVKALDLKSDGFEINAEILIGLLRTGKKVVEVPVQLTARKEGSSKLNVLRELRSHAALTLRLLLK